MKAPRWLATALAGAGALLCAGSASAFRSDAGASTFDSGHELYNRPRREWKLDEIPVPDVQVEKPKRVAEDTTPESRFALDRFDVVGNTLLPPETLKKTLQPYLGSDRSLQDLTDARDALRKAYENAGFLFVQVLLPRQEIREGRVRLDVVEARVGKVTVQNPGVAWYGKEQIERDIQTIRPGAPLRREDMQADLGRVRRPDATVTPVVKAGEEPGTVDVELRVQDRIPLHASVAWYNWHTPGTPPRRMDLGLRYANLWDLDHEVSGNFTFVPIPGEADQVLVANGSYSIPNPWRRQDNLFAYGSWSDTTATVVTAAGITSLGKSVTAGGIYTAALPSLSIGELDLVDRVSLGVDYKDFKSDLVSGPLVVATPIRYLPFDVAWEGNAFHPDFQSRLRIALDFNFAGLLDGGSEQDFQNSRGGVRPDSLVTGDYQILHGSLDGTFRGSFLLGSLAQGHPIENPARLRPLEQDWSIYAALQGQWASEPLVPFEQMPLGGPQQVRGYLQGEIFGDEGAVFRFEARTPVVEARPLPWLFGGLQGLVFYDIGQVRALSTIEDRKIVGKVTLAGTGVGFRATLLDYLTGELYVAWPLRETPLSRDPRFQFMLRASY